MLWSDLSSVSAVLEWTPERRHCTACAGSLATSAGGITPTLARGTVLVLP